MFGVGKSQPGESAVSRARKEQRRVEFVALLLGIPVFGASRVIAHNVLHIRLVLWVSVAITLGVLAIARFAALTYLRSKRDSGPK